jgi:hypothetical protein
MPEKKKLLINIARIIRLSEVILELSIIFSQKSVNYN